MYFFLLYYSGHICACESCAVLMKKCVTCRYTKFLLLPPHILIWPTSYTNFRSHIDRMSSLLVSCSKMKNQPVSNLISIPSLPSPPASCSSNNNNNNNNNNATAIVGAGPISSVLGPGVNVISNNTSNTNNSNVTGQTGGPCNLSPSIEANLLSSHNTNTNSSSSIVASGSIAGDNINHANNTGLSGAYGQTQLLNNGAKDYTVQKLQQQLQDIKEQVYFFVYSIQ